MKKLTILTILVLAIYTLPAQWELQYPLPTENALEDSFFTDDLNGWVVGENGIIIHTNDGGIIWELQNTGTDNTLYSTCFSTNGNAYAAGTYGTIIHENILTSLVENHPDRDSTHRVICYPNPFTTSTTIEYILQQPGTVQITIYNHLGEQVEVIRQS